MDRPFATIRIIKGGVHEKVYIDIYGYYAKIIFNKTYFNKIGFSKGNY